MSLILKVTFTLMLMSAFLTHQDSVLPKPLLGMGFFLLIGVFPFATAVLVSGFSRKGA